MKYHLLTGATGLLGGYLLRDLHKANLLLAVVVRPTRRLTAVQRIEGLMERWETQAGYSLPRPVVLNGDLTRPNLGLSQKDLAWIKANCSAMIHNAASLKFVGSNRQREPWLSNYQGTLNVLQLCREVGIRQFFHVSTAYVCGQRSGRILESESDVGQLPGNDYEASKLAAEVAVERADWLESKSIFRPAIIAGDSRTGFTSTFHGFYFPLKVGATFANKHPEIRGVEMSKIFQLLNLTGKERKNFVPVDWVSAVMARIISNPTAQNRTYHLTPDQRITMSRMADVMAESIHEAADAMPGSSPLESILETNAAQFQLLMTAYQSYWRDDPEFCKQNTLHAAPHLPCPEINETLLKRWCQYALHNDFMEPTHLPMSLKDVDADKKMQTSAPDVVSETPNTASSNPLENIQVQVNGSGGGQWVCAWSGNSVERIQPGFTTTGPLKLYLNSRTLRRIRELELSAAVAIGSGAVLVEGSSVHAASILTQFAQQTTSEHLLPSHSLETEA